MALPPILPNRSKPGTLGVGHGQVRRGAALYLVFGILVVLGVFALQFHQLSRHARATAFRFEKGEVVRQIAESASDEALIRLWNATADSFSIESTWFLDNSRTVLLKGTPQPRKLEVPMVESQLRSLAPGFDVTITQTLTIIDFRNYDRLTRGKFYPVDPSALQLTHSEGLGTYELSTEVELFYPHRKVSAASCLLTRHHDFKILSLISTPSLRRGYAHNFLLDYVLFVTDALREHQEADDQQSAFQNRRGLSLIIGDQDKVPPEFRGKVYLGGTEKRTDHPAELLFFNVPEDCPTWKDLVPKPPAEKHIFTIGPDECCELFPGLKPFRQYMDQLKGHFSLEILPAAAKADTKITPEWTRQIRSYLQLIHQNSNERHLRNIDPWTIWLAETPKLLTDPDYMKSIIDGRICQRFLYFVTFTADPSGIPDLPGDAKKHIEKLSHVPTFPYLPELASSGFPKLPEDVKTFLTTLMDWEKAGKAPFPLVSYLDNRFLLKGGQIYPRRDGPKPEELFSSPLFYHKTGRITDWDSIQPFSHPTLRFRLVDDLEQLEITRVYNPAKGELFLRGLTRVQGLDSVIPLQGKGGSPLVFHGSGILLSEAGFRITSGIRRAKPDSDDILILYARNGPIYVDTDQEIQAMLISTGKDGRIIPKKTLSLSGGVAVKRLETQQWPAGKHRISFDPRFRGWKAGTTGKAGEIVDRFQVLPSPHISLERVTMGKEQ
jgi:hypothetical protein